MVSRRRNSGVARLGAAVAVTVLAAVAAALGTATPAGSETGAGARRTYIVEMDTAPLAVSDGSVRALEAGRIRRFESLTAGSERRALASARARRAPVLHRYRSAFAGFAARLTDEQAARLANAAGVAAVTPETAYRPLAEPAGHASADAVLGQETPAFLGLPAGIWARSGGPAFAGDGVTIGVIDTGIHPEHPSFADTPDGPGGARRYDGPAYAAPSGWKGTCQTGADFPASACNNKLIGARFFVDGFKARNVGAGERLSPRDVIGHGTHVAATAAGNYGVKPVVGGHDLGIPAVSGIAPRARIAVYKICWTGRAASGDAADGTCMASDAVAAIDAAVADGVDVINYSVGSTAASVFGPVERAFLGAAAAGVFVANAAGNSGPEPGTLGSPNGVPWVTSVAATTLGRTFASPFVVTPRARRGGSPQAVAGTGASLAGSLRQAELVDGVTAAARRADRARAALCLPGSLSPAAVAGKAVVCRRGHTSRVEKSRVVHDAGGIALVLVNTERGQETAADLHWVPTVHVSADDGAAITALLAGGGPATLSLGGGQPVSDSADRVAAFSSRGPARAVPDIAKPDVAAPGVNILSADAPVRTAGFRPDALFKIRTGTSMASPEVAGAAALLIQLEPDWSPAAVKSALMTSAEPAVLGADGRQPAGPLDVGSGRIEPNRAATTGLLLDVAVSDYLRYLKGRVPEKMRGTDVTPIDPVDLNLPSVALSRFGHSVSTVRSFTSADRFRQRWMVTVEAPAGVTVTATPGHFEILPRATQAVTLTLRLAGASPGRWTSGAVVLVNETDGRRVRLPVSVQPVK